MDRKTRLEVNRSGYYEIRWTEPDGRTRGASTRTKDRSIAEKVARAFVLAGGVSQDVGAGTGKRVGELLKAYEGSLVIGACATQRICVKHLTARLGAHEVGDLTPEELRDYATARGVSGGTVRRELAALGAALRWCAGHRLIGAGDLPRIDLPAGGVPRASFLTEPVADELFDLARDDLDGTGRLSRVGRFICAALDTGARKSAVEGLTWDRVNLPRGQVDFRDGTLRVTKKRRVATPVTTRLSHVLERAYTERSRAAGLAGGGFVLDTNGDVRGEWDRFMARHGFEGVTPHVLRHTRITLLLQAGVSVWDVSGLVGASPDVIQEVYGHHVADDRLRKLADRRVA